MKGGRPCAARAAFPPAEKRRTGLFVFFGPKNCRPSGAVEGAPFALPCFPVRAWATARGARISRANFTRDRDGKTTDYAVRVARYHVCRTAISCSGCARVVSFGNVAVVFAIHGHAKTVTTTRGTDKSPPRPFLSVKTVKDNFGPLLGINIQIYACGII